MNRLLSTLTFASYRAYIKYPIRALQIGCAVHLFKERIADVQYCHGPSMLPRLSMTGDVVLLEHISHRQDPPQISVGDLVIAIHPYHPERLICKQVLGMPGDTVFFDPIADGGQETVVVPLGHVWLAGINTSNSTDSRIYGPIPIAMLRGKLMAKLYPSFEWITNNLEYVEECEKSSSMRHP